MSDNLVKRLREDQPVTQDMASTMQCALQDAAADRIEELEAKLARLIDIDLIEQAISDVILEGGSYRDAAEYVKEVILAELKGETDG